MTKNELELLLSVPFQSIAVADISGPDRTLLYGYTIERHTFHVYLKDGKIHKYVYSYDKETTYHREESCWDYASDLVPDKRVYPAASDLEFCRILLRSGVDIPCTTWEDMEQKQFHGDLYEGA